MDDSVSLSFESQFNKSDNSGVFRRGAKITDPKSKFKNGKMPSTTRTMGFGEEEDCTNLEVASTANFNSQADVKIRA